MVNNSTDHEEGKLKNNFKRQDTLRKGWGRKEGVKRESSYSLNGFISKLFRDVYKCQALFEALDMKTHYKTKVIRAAWYQHRKPEIAEH